MALAARCAAPGSAYSLTLTTISFTSFSVQNGQIQGKIQIPTRPRPALGTFSDRETHPPGGAAVRDGAPDRGGRPKSVRAAGPGWGAHGRNRTGRRSEQGAALLLLPQ